MKYLKFTLFASTLVALVLGLLLYQMSTRVPSKVVIAAGPAGGNYYQLSNEIAKRLEEQLGTEHRS